MIYPHVRQLHLRSAPSPIDWLPVRQLPIWQQPLGNTGATNSQSRRGSASAEKDVAALQHQLMIVTRNIGDFRNVGVPLFVLSMTSWKLIPRLHRSGDCWELTRLVGGSTMGSSWRGPASETRAILIKAEFLKDRGTCEFTATHSSA